MKKIFGSSSQAARSSERAQSIVIIAAAFIGLLAFVGLAIDMGILFISYGNLRRAADSAAIAAAAQFRENYTFQQLNSAATEYLRLNGVDLDNASAKVYTCEGDGANPDTADTDLCTTPKRKLVRVVATSHVNFVFLNVIGFYGTDITAEANGEAATMDVVLVIDISESMTYDANTDDPMRDPSQCNPTDECHPFREVKDAAIDLAKFVLNKDAAEEEDRLSLVVFSNGWQAPAEATPSNQDTEHNQGTYLVHKNTIRYTSSKFSGWFNDQNAAVAAINDLKVYDPAAPDFEGGWDGRCDGALRPGTCRNYDETNAFVGMECPYGREINAPYNQDMSTCTTTNIGGGLKLAGAQFAQHPNMDAVWVVILLTDGAANASCKDDTSGINCNQSVEPDDLPVSYCPAGTNDFDANPNCRDTNIATFHSVSNPAFDSDDYARQAALFVGCPASISASVAGYSDCKNYLNYTGGEGGQGAVIFSVGLGSGVMSSINEVHGKPYGDSLLRYVAAVGDDGNPDTDACAGTPVSTNSYHCGNYYYAKTGADLEGIFSDIASRIFTRLSK